MQRRLGEITVEVIQKCNSKCIFCSSVSSQDCKNEISLDILKQIALFSKEKGATSINISGGEPLLKDDLLDFISYNASIGLYSIIYTSGNVFIDNFLKELKNNKELHNKTNFIFNYQSVYPQIFSRLTKCKEETIGIINSNIEKCINSDFNVEAHIVPNALNIDTIYETCLFLKDIGVSKVSLLRMVFQGRAVSSKDVLKIEDEDTLKKIIDKIQGELVDDDFKLRVGIPFSKYSCENKTCNAGLKKLIIRYDGVAFPCEAFKEASNNDRYILGNIYKDSLENIWDRYYTTNELLELKMLATKDNEACPAQLLYM